VLPSVIHRRRTVHVAIAKGVKAEKREPSALVERTMYARDGRRCRFCGCRVVPNDTRDRMRAMLPGAIRLGPSAKDYHAAFLALNAVPDHVIPHAAGGSNDLDNLVTACRPCNNGRGAYSLEEMGLIDPRSRPPIVDRDGWDGLRRILGCAADTSSPPAHSPGQEGYPKRAMSRVPDTAARSSPAHLSEAKYFDLLASKHPGAVKPLAAFLASLSEIDVVPEYRRSVVLRFLLSPGVRASAGYVDINGGTYITDAYYYANKHGCNKAGQRYLDTVATIAGGAVRRYEKAPPEVIMESGASLDVTALLQDAAGWKNAIVQLVSGLRVAADG